MSDFSLLTDNLWEFSLLALLAAVVAHLRGLPGLHPRLDAACGLLLGTSAAMMMFSNGDPDTGLSVDLRAIPIALAGAFLGPVALVSALLPAAVAQMVVGGVGAPAGLVALLLAGLAGWLWRLFVRPRIGNVTLRLLALGLMISAHLPAVFLLPKSLAGHYMRDIAPQFVVINLVSALVYGAIVKREEIACNIDGYFRRAGQAADDVIRQRSRMRRSEPAQGGEREDKGRRRS